MTSDSAPLHVSDAAKLLSRQCPRNFACLESNGRDVPKITNCVEGKIHFVDCKAGQTCLYAMEFGEGRICLCPTRIELYRKYGI